MKKLTKKLDQWPLQRVMSREPDLIQDIKKQLKQTANWEPAARAIYIRCLKLLDPKE